MSFSLNQLTYLALDCQTTGNNPKNDHLLEIGWCVFNLSDNTPSEACQTFIIRQAEGAELSKRIQRLTGIETNDLAQGVAVGDALDALLQSARDVAMKNGMPGCPTVIHYARFEMGFLQHALKRFDRPAGALLDVICTHQMATRLMPELPRKGLRAVAGYLGHSVPEAKRCIGHLQATQWIWRHMVQRLADEAGVETLNQLKQWLSNSAKPNTPKRYPMPEAIRKTVPADPGIYRMKRDNGDLLYIGKAANLKQRVNSYFHHSRRHPEHVLEMLTQAKDLAVTPTATALEAALLETDVIKQENPPYNIALTGSHRGIFYISRDFEKQAPKHQKTCPLGPVPSVETFTAAYALGKQLQAPDRETGIDILMAMPLDYCPDKPTLDAGFSLFRQTHGHLFKQKPIGPAVMRMGHLSWLQKLEDKNASAEPSSTDDPEEEIVEFVWTPEAVANTLESICRRCGFLLRRARWFRLLADSQVEWQRETGEIGAFRVLTLNDGAVVKRASIEGTGALSQPYAFDSAKAGLAASMNLETYDRLRVLTTEIRRLVAQERLIIIQLNKGARLHSKQLQKLLLWI